MLRFLVICFKAAESLNDIRWSQSTWCCMVYIWERIQLCSTVNYLGL